MSNGRSSAGELLHAPTAHARPRGRAAEELSRSEERFFKVFQASPVAIVKVDHHTTTRVSTLRGPIRSPSQPPGTSKMA